MALPLRTVSGGFAPLRRRLVLGKHGAAPDHLDGRGQSLLQLAPAHDTAEAADALRQVGAPRYRAMICAGGFPKNCSRVRLNACDFSPASANSTEQMNPSSMIRCGQ
jgi:hypothetical protein